MSIHPFSYDQVSCNTYRSISLFFHQISSNTLLFHPNIHSNPASWSLITIQPHNSFHVQCAPFASLLNTTNVHVLVCLKEFVKFYLTKKKFRILVCLFVCFIIFNFKKISLFWFLLKLICFSTCLQAIILLTQSRGRGPKIDWHA